MVTERTIINALIIGASLILVPFIISSTLTVDYVPVFFFGGLTLLVAAFFVLKERLCLCPLLASSIAGSLNFLPLPLRASDIFCILLILYYITGYVIIRQKRMKLGPTNFLWPMLIIVSIVLYHNHNLNVGVLGGDTEGAKPAILIYLVILAYFCGINLTRPSVEWFTWIPFIFVLFTVFSSIPNLLSTYIPSMAPYLFTVTDNVNVEAYINSQPGSGSAPEAGISRLSAFGAVGGALQGYLVCRFPIGTWLRPERWWVAGLSLLCGALAISSGYRSTLFAFAMITMVGVWCYYSWRALVLPGALFLAALLFLIASSNNVVHLPVNRLPLIAQRSLSFLPGDWDEEALESAKSSNFFRQNIQDVYIKEYFPRSPMFGNGFTIDTGEFNALSDSLRSGNAGADPDYTEAKAFIEGKLFHTGWISLYDAVGIVGFLAFIALGFYEIRAVAHFIVGSKADRRSTLFPLYVWLLCNIVTMMVAFFTVFGDFKQTFMDLCIYAMVLSHLRDLEQTTEVPVVLRQNKGHADLSPVGEGQYGYQSRR
jgi:hypothetical protein